MRPIKFRAWDSKRKEMFVPALINQNEGTIRFVGDSPKDTILLQFTGLTDKHGKEIYEGDVLKWSSVGNVVIEWIRGGFAYKLADGKPISENMGIQTHFQTSSEHLEIIGNIYESPNLIP